MRGLDFSQLIDILVGSEKKKILMKQNCEEGRKMESTMFLIQSKKNVFVFRENQ